MKSLWLRCTPLILWGTVMAFLSSQSFSQPAVWPDKPVRLVVPYAPGGTTDTQAVRPTRSSRTSVRSPQISYAHNR